MAWYTGHSSTRPMKTSTHPTSVLLSLQNRLSLPGEDYTSSLLTTWSGPVNAGGSVITKYRVEWSTSSFSSATWRNKRCKLREIRLFQVIFRHNLCSTCMVKSTAETGRILVARDELSQELRTTHEHAKYRCCVGRKDWYVAYLHIHRNF